MNNIGNHFVSMSIRALIAYGLFISFISPMVIHCFGIFICVFFTGCVITYLAMDMSSEREVMGGSLWDLHQVESMTPSKYIVGTINSVMDVAILYFLVGSPMVAAVYGITSTAFRLYVYEHQKAIFKIRKKGEVINEQTNSLHG